MSLRVESSNKIDSRQLLKMGTQRLNSKRRRQLFHPFERVRPREERGRDTHMEVAVAIAMPISSNASRRQDTLGSDNAAKVDEAPTLCLGLVEVPLRDGQLV